MDMDRGYALVVGISIVFGRPFCSYRGQFPCPGRVFLVGISLLSGGFSSR